MIWLKFPLDTSSGRQVEKMQSGMYSLPPAPLDKLLLEGKHYDNSQIYTLGYKKCYYRKQQKHKMKTLFTEVHRFPHIHLIFEAKYSHNPLLTVKLWLSYWWHFSPNLSINVNYCCASCSRYNNLVWNKSSQNNFPVFDLWNVTKTIN